MAAHCTVLAAALVFLAIASRAVQSTPNIVLLFADDLGYGDLGCYGHPTSHSPNLDKMAAEGLRFTQFYSASPVCSPSRAALLTGRYQIRSGIWPMVFGASSTGGLPHNETTIAEGLKKVGYATGMVGKWHLGVGANNTYLPVNQGFDHYLGIPFSHDMCPCAICFYPNQSCFDGCRKGEAPCPLFMDNEIVQQPADLTTLTQRYTDAATGFIQKSAAAKTPFFLYMAYQHTHHPQFAGQKFRNSTSRGTMGDSLIEMDDSVGQIFAALKASGVDDNTFVFFTADNGPSLTRHVRGGNQGLLKCGKGTTYEGGQREPALAWMPGKIAAGQITHELAGTVDVLPTVFKLTGAEIPSDRIIDGVDMSSILFTEQGKAIRTHYFYYPKNPEPTIGLYGIRNNQYKAHFYTEGSHCGPPYRDEDCWSKTGQKKQDPPILFNLLIDPSERYPISPKSDEYKTVMAELNQTATEFSRTAVFRGSEIHGSSAALQPCCKPGCKPFPGCCVCNKLPYSARTSPPW
ncbi:arylsulfatase A-like isoform X1 [Sycon ciliatum]|uniref:arylsulfatase A-like isoform X1 n=1 Tax=Sycon ciliatum TaxID=27933 RepID=UPI0031F6361D